MDFKRFAEWLSTTDGIVKALAAVAGFGFLTWTHLSKVFDAGVERVGLPAWTSFVALLLVFAALLWLALHSFRRFARASRLERPEAFALRPTGPESLIGRDEDLAKLINAVKRSRLVLLDGESGCGKSALVNAGLVPVLQESAGLLPLVLRDWGDDWVRGPLACSLDALFHGLSDADRVRTGCSMPPDLAADVHALTADLDRRLRAIVDALGRRPLLIADQFDDYQALHRERFLDEDGNWLTSADLSGVNPFWQVIGDGLRESRLHLLVVTRADMAAGLTSVRFLGEDQTTTRTLSRVEIEYLHRLLTAVAADDAQPPVVSNPAGGWHELRERLERELKAQGAILMQQVRTVLLGLRQLSLLTPRRYRAAGGLHGLETLVVSRALRRAGDTLGGGESAVQTARAVLGALIVRDGPDQTPKSQRVQLPMLGEIAGDGRRAASILRALQDDEVVRPAEAIGGISAWQLDHDYLARAVLAESRQADRWSTALREGKARYDQAASLGKWSVPLLPPQTLFPILWERARGRLAFGEAAGYVWKSSFLAAAVAAAFLAATLPATLTYLRHHEDWALNDDAWPLVNQLGSSAEANAVLLTWRAREPVRQRVYEILQEFRLLERAVRGRWPLAHAGLERRRVREAAIAIRERLERERSDTDAGRLVETYALAAQRMTEPSDAKEEAAALSLLLQHERNESVAFSVRRAYAAMARRLTTASDLRSEADALRLRLEQTRDDVIAESLSSAYVAVVEATADNEHLEADARALHARLQQEQDDSIASSIAWAYAAVVRRLADPVESRVAATALRARMDQARDAKIAWRFAEAYTGIAAQLTEASDVKTAALVLRERLEHERNPLFRFALADTYVMVATRLTKPDLEEEARALHPRLGREQDSAIANDLAWAYAAVVAELADAATLRSGAETLRTLLERERDERLAYGLAQAYAAVATRLADAPDVIREAAEIRRRLEKERQPSIAEHLERAYRAISARLTRAADVMSEATALRTRLERERDARMAGILAEAYAGVAEQLVERSAVMLETSALRRRFDQEQDRFIATRLAFAYGAAAARLSEATELESAATALRTRIEQEQDAVNVSWLASAYAKVARRLSRPGDLETAAGVLRRQLEEAHATADVVGSAYATVMTSLMERSDDQRRPALTVEILTLAGHPFVQDCGPLLGALKPAAGVDFGSDVSAAVRWAERAYGISTAQLRPSATRR